MEQIKDMLRNAFVTDLFKNTKAQGNNGQNKHLLTQKAVEAWTEYFGRYGYLTIENKKKLECLTTMVLKDVENASKCFKTNKIDIIVKALNVVIPVRGGGMGVIMEEEAEEEQLSFTVPESIQHQQQEELNTSTNSLFGFVDTMEVPRVVYGDDDNRDYELEHLLDLAIPEAVTSSYSYGLCYVFFVYVVFVFLLFGDRKTTLAK